VNKSAFQTCLLFVFMTLIACSASAVQSRLQHTSGNSDDSFGESVAIQGNTILVGAPYNDDAGIQAGALYVYDYDGSDWLQNQILMPPSIGDLYFFGASVDIDGDYAIAGAYGAVNSSSTAFRSGTAYIYRYDGSSWSFDTELHDSNSAGLDDFGMDVAITGDYAFAGSPGDDDNGQDSGSVFIYHSNGTTWSFHQKLMSGTDGDHFGKSISVDGSWAVIGAYGDNSTYTDSGAAYIYHFDGSVWTESQKLKAGDPGTGDAFGLAVAIDGQQLLIGAPYDNDNGPSSGSVYVFAYENSIWTQHEKILASDGTVDHLFGNSLDISRKYAVVGAFNDSEHGIRSGAGYLLYYNERTWVEFLKFNASDASAYDKFGYSVALTEDFAVAGAPQDHDESNDEGEVYVFDDVALFRPLPTTSSWGIPFLMTLFSFIIIRQFN